MNQVLLTLCNMLLNILEIFVLLLLAGGLFSAKLHRLRYVVTILILFLLHVGGASAIGRNSLPPHFLFTVGRYRLDHNYL